ncbi:MAG TPA: 2-dehydropantoate 2-reductase [Actinomycetes bacterium]|nr:2-dehydropantoate 2-reductase [Actinomycetes bacterium]
MRLVVVGAGATGGFLGGFLARAGHDVTLVARGAQLEAMRRRGLVVRTAEGAFTVRPRCTDDLGAVGDADAAFLAVKAHAVAPLAPRLGKSLGPDTALVTLQNGIPWWYFQRHGGPLEGTRLEAVDPDGAIERNLDARHVVGAVVYPATRIVEPGVIEHVEGTRFTIGEPDGSRSERCQAIADALVESGLKCPVRTDIRKEIWLKLIGNAVLNPLSALTRASLAALAADPGTRAAALGAMGEAVGVAGAVGVELDLSVEQRLEGAARVGEHRTSMLQDVEAGRPLEVDALVGAVVEIGHLVGLELPRLETLYACVKLLDRGLRGG